LLSAYFTAGEEPLKRRNGLKLRNNEPRKDSQFLIDQTSACSFFSSPPGLTPVVHADVQLSRPFKKVLQAWLPHGLPGQARQ
jgi:hypothetical protein